MKVSFSKMIRWLFKKILVGEHKENTKYFQKLPKETIHVSVPQSQTRVSWLGHSTVLIQTHVGDSHEPMNIILDPIWSKRISGVVARTTGIPIELEDVPHIDVCLISHDHYDHLHTRSLNTIAPDVVIAGENMKSVMNKKHTIVELPWWGTTSYKGLKITFVPSKHWSKRGLHRKNKNLWGGFVLETGTTVIYYSGDTAYCDAPKLVKEKFPVIDLAILPIGCYEPKEVMEFHTNPEQSFEFFKTLGAKNFLPVHWGTYNLSAESIYDPIERLQKAFVEDQMKHPDAQGKLQVLPVGGTFSF